MMQKTILAMAALTVISQVLCYAQSAPVATPDRTAAAKAIKVPVCVDVEAPETVKKTITDVIVGVLNQDDNVRISDDQASAYVVFHVEVIENGSSGYAASIVATSHEAIDTLLNNIPDANSEKELRKDYKDAETLEWNNLYVASTIEDLCTQFLRDIQVNTLADIRGGIEELENMERRLDHK